MFNALKEASYTFIAVSDVSAASFGEVPTPANIGIPQMASTALKRRHMDTDDMSEQGSEADFDDV